MMTDDEPFDDTPLTVAWGNQAERTARTEGVRVMRERAAQWAAAHDFDAVGTGLVRVVESVEVNIALSATTTEMCMVHANAVHPAPLHFTIQPKSWTDRIAERFGGAFETDDRDFDEQWRVEADDETVAMRLLDTRVRAALMNHPVWCHVTYANGRIDLRIDAGSERLKGAHLLAATEVAVALARANPQLLSAPYR